MQEVATTKQQDLFSPIFLNRLAIVGLTDHYIHERVTLEAYRLYLGSLNVGLSLLPSVNIACS